MSVEERERDSSRERDVEERERERGCEIGRERQVRGGLVGGLASKNGKLSCTGRELVREGGISLFHLLIGQAGQ